VPEVAALPGADFQHASGQPVEQAAAVFGAAAPVGSDGDLQVLAREAGVLQFLSLGHRASHQDEETEAI
jgi:hypothetical protein